MNPLVFVARSDDRLDRKVGPVGKRHQSIKRELRDLAAEKLTETRLRNSEPASSCLLGDAPTPNPADDRHHEVRAYLHIGGFFRRVSDSIQPPCL